MKKRIFTLAILACATVAAVAQPRAIGGRLGTGMGFSYEHGLGNNMLSIDAYATLPFNNSYGLGTGVGAAVTYDWIFPITSWDEEGSWNWYVGVGGAFGNRWGARRLDDHLVAKYGDTFVGVAGRIGVEYNFWFPLQLSLDWRPTFGPAFYYGNHGRDNSVHFNDLGLYDGIALGVRYKF